MVRRGSPVRVRKRALQKRLKAELFFSGSVAELPACGRYGALDGAFRSKTPSATRRFRSVSGRRATRGFACAPSRASVSRTTAASLWFLDASSSLASCSVTGLSHTFPGLSFSRPSSQRSRWQVFAAFLRNALAAENQELRLGQRSRSPKRTSINSQACRRRGGRGVPAPLPLPAARTCSRTSPRSSS